MVEKEIKEDCIYFECEEIGGTKKFPQVACFCNRKSIAEHYLDCKNCKVYISEKELLEEE